MLEWASLRAVPIQRRVKLVADSEPYYEDGNKYHSSVESHAKANMLASTNMLLLQMVESAVGAVLALIPVTGVRARLMAVLVQRKVQPSTGARARAKAASMVDRIKTCFVVTK